MAGPFVFPACACVKRDFFCPAADHLRAFVASHTCAINPEVSKDGKDRKLFPQLKIVSGPRTF